MQCLLLFQDLAPLHFLMYSKVVCCFFSIAIIVKVLEHVLELLEKAKGMVVFFDL